MNDAKTRLHRAWIMKVATRWCGIWNRQRYVLRLKSITEIWNHIEIWNANKYIQVYVTRKIGAKISLFFFVFFFRKKSWHLIPILYFVFRESDPKNLRFTDFSLPPKLRASCKLSTDHLSILSIQMHLQALFPHSVASATLHLLSATAGISSN